METAKTRMPVVAGQFYPAERQQIKNQIGSFLEKKVTKIQAIACMLPHAGYIYSGRVAAQTVAQIDIREKIILLGPNHTGKGQPYSIMTGGLWQTPLGSVKIDSVLARRILNSSKHLKEDTSAHIDEHSLEVELPILQYFKQDFQIVPIAFLSHNIKVLKEIGKEIAGALKDAKCEDSVLLVASSDMTHYEPKAIAQKKDKEALDAILELNEDKLIQKIQELDITMCGYAPVVVMLSCAKLLGAKTSKLTLYQTSADTTGDAESVVGYAGVIIH